jgi:hypothetical protein
MYREIEAVPGTIGFGPILTDSSRHGQKMKVFENKSIMRKEGGFL